MPGFDLGVAALAGSEGEEYGDDDDDDDEDRDAPVRCSIQKASVDLELAALTLKGRFCDDPTVSLGIAGGGLAPLTVAASGATFIEADLAPWIDAATRVAVVECPRMSVSIPLCGDGEITFPETCESDVDCAAYGPDGDCEQCGCSNIAVCGDGVVTPPEECDPPGSDVGLYWRCSLACHIEECDDCDPCQGLDCGGGD